MIVLRRLIKKHILNIKNVFMYGIKAPRYGELIYVKPTDIQERLDKNIRIKLFGTPNPYSSSIIGGNWDQFASKEALQDTHDACWNHFVNKVSWKSTEKNDLLMERISNSGLADGCRSCQDVVERYQRLDTIYEQIKKEKTLRTSRVKLLTVFIARDGSPIHSGGGNTDWQ